MLKNNKGFSLTILIIAITVIVIITSTAVVSVRNISKDRAISNFMNDLATVKQFSVEYVSRNREFTY